jgi:hypothetical protein
VYSAGAVVIFSHGGLWWLLDLDGSASHDFAADLVINETENRRPYADQVSVRVTSDDSKSI